MAEPDKPIDEALTALYRGLPRDEPTAEIDAAVLAAAQRSVERPSRKWGAPVALAAVLVLSVGISLRVAQEKPDAQLQPAAPVPLQPSPLPSVPAPVSTAPPAAEALPKPSEAPTKVQPRKPPVAPRQEMARGVAREERVERSPAREAPSASASQAQPPIAFVPDPRADVARPAPPAAPSALGSASAPAAAERSAARGPMRGAPAAAQDAAPPSLAKSTAESNLAAAAQSPEAWLERIAEMRAQGRVKEADESLAEFRRRYPAFVISPEMLRKIEPAR